MSTSTDALRDTRRRVAPLGGATARPPAVSGWLIGVLIAAVWCVVSPARAQSGVDRYTDLSAYLLPGGLDASGRPGASLPGGKATSMIYQTGQANVAGADVQGTGNITRQYQAGDINTSSLTTVGNGNTLASSQIGNRNTSSISIVGQGNAIQDSQVGNNLSFSLQQVGNAKAIVIHQSGQGR